MRLQIVASTALIAWAACGDNLAPPDPRSCEADPDPRCANPIDRVLVPALRAIAMPLIDAPADELCRRLYIDLIDRAPTLDERAACLRDPYEDVVDRVLADPAHERTWRARWSKLLGYNLYAAASRDVVDLDARIGAMDRGDITYPEFAAAVAWHPAFWALHKDDEWAAALYPAFLGRPARADEIAGLRPLTRIWRQRIYAEGFFWFAMHQKALADGMDEAGATAFANIKASNGAKADWGVDVCACDGGEGVAGCASETLGTRVAFTQRCAPGVTVHRTRDFTPGQDDECPDHSHRFECADRLTDFAGGYLPIEPLPALDDATRKDLDGVGRALAARHDFWDAAADRELRWLLGWWQTTFVRPDSDLPAVRALLAETLRAGATPREIDRLIVTSLLYRLPATPPSTVDPATLPPWAMGPTKLLAGEGWLRAAATVVGETVAPCDHRFVVRGGWDIAYVDPRLLAPEPSSLDAMLGPSFHIDASMALGGCNGDILRPVISNLGLAYAQSQLARPLCAYGGGVLPPSWDGADLGAAVDHLAAAILSRQVAGDERAELVGEMRACRDAAAGPGGDQGCVDDESAVRWMCRRMLDSVEFGTY
jgi:Protein of unknown function (DUF1549)